MFGVQNLEMISSKQPCSMGSAEIVVACDHQPFAGENA